MNRILALSALLATTCLSPPAEANPNIIVLLADDLGATDIGPVRRKPGLATPNLDRLASMGTVYTDAYAAPVCVQARTMLMSGRWQQRRSVGGVNNNGPTPPASLVTLPERLRALGYTTHLVGKWHLGMSGGKHPIDQGFDTFLGFSGTPTPDYVGNDPDAPLYRQKTKVKNTGNVTETLGREAVKIVSEPHARPYFLEVAWTATHDPLQDTLANVLAVMDREIGKVVDAALASGEPPLIFFTGDNARFSNAPFRGKKYDIWEGGVRVPFTMAWPGHVEAGAVVDVPISIGDIAVTAVRAAGGDQPDTDFWDLLSPLPADRPVFLKAMYQDPGVAVRQGPWKLYLDHKSVPVALYDVESDPGEARNVALQRPDMVERMRPQLEAFRAELAN
jgi:arylsulfatase A-like enzyme